MKKVLVVVLGMLVGCGGTTEPKESLPDGGYLLRIEQPQLGAAQDTASMRVASGQVLVDRGVVSGNIGLRSYTRAAGNPACSGQPRSCWANSWTSGAGQPLTTTATLSGTNLSLSFELVFASSTTPPSAHLYRFTSPYTVAYDSSGAGVYELRRVQ